MSRSFAEAVKYNDTYSSMFGQDTVMDEPTWGIFQDAPRFHDDWNEDLFEDGEE